MAEFDRTSLTDFKKLNIDPTTGKSIRVRPSQRASTTPDTDYSTRPPTTRIKSNFTNSQSSQDPHQ